MNPLICLFLAALFIEDYFFRQGKYIKYYLYSVIIYSIFYFFLHKSQYHNLTKKYNMSAYDQSFDSTVYARVKFDLSMMRSFLTKYSEKAKKEITLSDFWIKVLGDVFLNVAESSEKIRFGLKGLRDSVDISVLVNTKDQDTTYIVLRDVPKKTLEQIHDEFIEKSKQIELGKYIGYNKSREFLKKFPTLYIYYFI